MSWTPWLRGGGVGLAGFGGKAGLLAARREATAAADMILRLLPTFPVPLVAAVPVQVVSLTLLPLTDTVAAEDTSFPPWNHIKILS